MRVMLKRACSVFMLLGITSSIGALTNGNDPTLSLSLIAYAFLGLVWLNA
jgi:hypothetical protein